MEDVRICLAGDVERRGEVETELKRFVGDPIENPGELEVPLFHPKLFLQVSAHLSLCLLYVETHDINWGLANTLFKHRSVNFRRKDHR